MRFERDPEEQKAIEEWLKKNNLGVEWYE